MKSAKNLRVRIKTARNIAQITRAMEMVAASKMKRAQETALSGREYSEELSKVIRRLSEKITEKGSYPLLSGGNQNSPIGVIIFSTDKGLCGSLNTNLFTALEKLKSDTNNKKITVIAMGKKGSNYAGKIGLGIEASFNGISDRPKLADISPLAKLTTEIFVAGGLSEVYVIYPSFVSTLVQKANTIRLLPLSAIGITVDDAVSLSGDYIFEPAPAIILNNLLNYYVENRLYQLMLETKASEHSSRMIAMRSASDSASELMDGLKLMYNRGRQAKITGELLDATGSRMALSE